jgi:hypothetical protein
MAHMPRFTGLRFVVRWFLSCFLVMATYNPTGVSFFHWITSRDEDYLSLKVAVGMLLLAIYTAIWPILYTSLGPIGMFLTTMIMVTGSLVMWDYGLLDHVRPSFYPYGVLMGLATVIAVGITYSHLHLQILYIKMYRKVTVKRYPTPVFPGPPPPPPLPPGAPPPII